MPNDEQPSEDRFTKLSDEISNLRHFISQWFLRLSAEIHARDAKPRELEEIE